MDTSSIAIVLAFQFCSYVGVVEIEMRIKQK